MYLPILLITPRLTLSANASDIINFDLHSLPDSRILETANTVILPDKMSFRYGMSLHVTVHVAPRDVDRFFAAFKPVFNKIIAEPECLMFEVYRDPREPGKISWVEDWSKSPLWFRTEQMTKDYYKEYLAITEPLFVKPRESQFLERLGPLYCYDS